MGRRLAFDQAKGRLWVICERCSRWNLTPVEERWEAIEACEKAYRDTPKRLATDQIGLAKVNDGLALVRIGTPVFPEYASWRYGERFARRRTRYYMVAAASVVGAGAVFIGGPFLAKAVFGVGGGSWYWIYNLYAARQQKARFDRNLGSVSDGEGTSVIVRGGHAEGARLISGGPDQLRIEVEPSKKWRGKHATQLTLREGAAKSFLHLALPHLNRKGATEAQVAEGVQALDLASGPADPLLSSQLILSRAGYGSSLLTELPAPLSIGLEMAVMEGQERAWLETQLSLLEVAWKEADELASTADELTLPGWIGQKVEDLRKGSSST